MVRIRGVTSDLVDLATEMPDARTERRPDGPLLGVTGSAKSGRSTTLAFLGKMAADRGRQVVSVVLSRRSPLAEMNAPWLTKCSLDDVEQIAAGLSDDPVILIDDLNRLAGEAIQIQIPVAD